MKFKLKTKDGIKEFEGELTLVTYDIYFTDFNSDLLIDATRTIQVTGMYSRAYLLRVMYAMIRTVDPSFIDFISFLNILEDDVIQFFKDLDTELTDLITNKITARVENEVINNDKTKN